MKLDSQYLLLAEILDVIAVNMFACGLEEKKGDGTEMDDLENNTLNNTTSTIRDTAIDEPTSFPSARLEKAEINLTINFTEKSNQDSIPLLISIIRGAIADAGKNSTVIDTVKINDAILHYHPLRVDGEGRIRE